MSLRHRGCYAISWMAKTVSIFRKVDRAEKLLRRAPPAVSLAVALLAGCASTAPAPRATVRTVGDETVVSVDQDAPVPENAACVQYCARLEACRHAVPGVDLTLPAAAFIERCRAERDGCRTPTTSEFCCTRFENCSDFGRCQAESADKVQSCDGPERRY